MKTILPLLFFGVVAGSCLVGAAGKLPAFTVERWVNSTPLTVEALRGKVVLLDIWVPNSAVDVVGALAELELWCVQANCDAMPRLDIRRRA
jgi:hypothetical protein